MAQSGAEQEDCFEMTMRAIFYALAVWCLLIAGAVAHEVRPAYLELSETEPGIYEGMWKVPARGDDMRLALDVPLSVEAYREVLDSEPLKSTSGC